jgi:hypothetical protein
MNSKGSLFTYALTKNLNSPESILHNPASPILDAPTQAMKETVKGKKKNEDKERSKARVEMLNSK